MADTNEYIPRGDVRGVSFVSLAFPSLPVFHSSPSTENVPQGKCTFKLNQQVSLLVFDVFPAIPKTQRKKFV